MGTLSESEYYRNKMSSFMLILFFIFFSGCETNTPISEGQLSQIDFELVVLNEDDEEAIIFDDGSDIRIALTIINNSKTELEWSSDHICKLFRSEAFLFVHKRDLGSEANHNYISVGTPYQPPINCPTYNLKQQIPPGESIIIKLKWSDNPNNMPLTAGSYYVSSSFEIKIDDNARSWVLRSDFEIQ